MTVWLNLVIADYCVDFQEAIFRPSNDSQEVFSPQYLYRFGRTSESKVPDIPKPFTISATDTDRFVLLW